MTLASSVAVRTSNPLTSLGLRRDRCERVASAMEYSIRAPPNLGARIDGTYSRLPAHYGYWAAMIAMTTLRRLVRLMSRTVCSSGETGE